MIRKQKKKQVIDRWIGRLDRTKHGLDNQERIFLITYDIRDQSVEVVETYRRNHTVGDSVQKMDPDPWKRDTNPRLAKKPYFNNGHPITRGDFYENAELNVGGHVFILGEDEDLLFKSNEDDLDEFQVRDTVRKIAWKLNLRRKQVTKTFMLIDEDKSGKIGLEEFGDICNRRWQLNLNRRQVAKIVKLFDEDGDEQIDLKEFKDRLQKELFDQFPPN